MPMSTADAAQRADSLINKMLEHQQLWQPGPPNEIAGAKMAEAIAAIRAGLIKMYESQP